MPEIADLITPEGVCSSTVFVNSWVWYCDEHQQHGTAMSPEEAEHYAKAHAEWYTRIYQGDEDDESLDSIGTSIHYPDLAPEEKEFYEDEVGESCMMFIIDEAKNKTFEYGSDYTDDTPNQVGDIEIAQHLRDQLGLP